MDSHPRITKAIKRTRADRAAWNHFGRPPAIPDIVEHCKDYRRDLVYVRNSIDMLGRTRHRLGRIIETVNEYEEEARFWDEIDETTGDDND